MCIIIDAAVAGKVFCSPIRPEYKPIFEWIAPPYKTGRLVYGGKLERELKRMAYARRLLDEWKRSGKAIQFTDEDLRNEESKLRKKKLRSNDPHVIALALVSRARTLCTDDQDLMDDFGDPKIISNPRGKIYRNASHKKLLRHHSGCKT